MNKLVEEFLNSRLERYNSRVRSLTHEAELLTDEKDEYQGELETCLAVYDLRLPEQLQDLEEDFRAENRLAIRRYQSAINEDTDRLIKIENSLIDLRLKIKLIEDFFKSERGWY